MFTVISLSPFSVAAKGDFFMENTGEKRIAVISIIVENKNSTERINSLLHDYGEYIVGRIGIPYREKNISVLAVVIDAEPSVINSLTGKLGMAEGVSAKSLFSKF